MAIATLQGTYTDGNGAVVTPSRNGTISVFLAGTTTPADIYTTSALGTAVHSVTTDSGGYWRFYVSTTDYAVSQLFDIVISGTGISSKTFTDQNIFNALNASAGDMFLATAQTVTGAKTFNAGTLKVGENVAVTSTSTELNLLHGITVLSGSNTGNETLVSIGTLAHSATTSTTILDADEVTFYSATLSALRKITWANIKVALNGVYLALTGGTLTGNLNIGVSGTGADESIYATTGSELAPAITNALWTPGAGWTITDLTNIATRVASAVTTLVPATPITANVAKKYKRTFTISSWTAGTITATFGGVVSTPFAGNQTVTLYIEPYTTGTLIFTPSADFAGVISAVSLKELTVGNLTVENDITSYDSRGHVNSMARFIRHTAEMWQNTLLDKSQSALSCTGSVLTYTLIATYGKGKFDFNGVIYPDVVNSVSIALTAGTDAAPVTNYVYFRLVGNTPTLSVATGTPPTNSSTAPIIRVARFVVGAVSGSSYTIYAYERYRQEVDTFVNRTISRIEASGSGYDSGLLPTVATTTLSIAVGTFFNSGIFNMTSANAPTVAGGFYWVDGLGAVHTATSIASLDHYGDGSNTAVSSNNRQNIVWGIVPTTTTAGGTRATTVKLFAVLQAVATSYTTDAQAIQDASEGLTLFPPNAEIAKCFVPVCRTIVQHTTPAFKPFVTGIYYKDMRGQVSTTGSTPVSVDITGLVPKTTTITTTTPITIDGTTSADLSANRTIAIPAATAAVNGYATATQINKLDGIAAGATANTKATGAEINAVTDDTKFATPKAIGDSTIKMWKIIPAANYTAAPASTSTITMGVDMTASVLVGMGVRYTISSVEYFGQITAMASNLMTIGGGPLGGNVSNLQYLNSQLVQVTYDNSASTSVLTTGTVYTLRWGTRTAYLVGYEVYQTIHDTGTHGKVTVKINGTEVNTSAGGLTVAGDATWYSTVVDIDTAAYDVNRTEDVTIYVTQGSNVNGYGLKVNMYFLKP